MQKALAGGEDGAYRPGLDAVAEDLQGSVGLLLTNRSPKEVEAYFAQYAVEDFARAGFEATETVTIPAGKLEHMPHTMTETLRKLGMPVVLRKGIVHVEQEYTVCTKGKELTPEQGKLLKLFDKQMAVFRVLLLGRWSASKGDYSSLEAAQRYTLGGKYGVRKGTEAEQLDEEDDAEMEDEDEEEQ